MNDAPLVRQILIESMRLSNKSRAQIADEMTYLCGRAVTERMLNAFTAESREDHRFPSELERAFCKATGTDRLLKVRAELAGYKVVGQDEQDLIELGRQYFIRKSSEQVIADLMQRIARRQP